LPGANWQGTVYHGLPRRLHAFEPQGGKYLAFLGRISPEKRLDRAIEIACKSGMPLKVAAKIYDEDRPYFESTIAPLLSRSHSFVEFIGEVGGQRKDEFLRGAAALLFPIDWAEPFGLVMIESLACGTPVIAWRNGSVPEIIEHGATGFVVDTLDEATACVGRISEIRRARCRRSFEERFDSRRMALDYLSVYRRLIADCTAGARLPARYQNLYEPESRWSILNG
jgi:glycosyltransferase involved in cell wall biosynthesis